MEDIIYGLLVFAWVVYGIYSASKKNKAKGSQQTPHSPAPQSKDTVEAIFESIFTGSTPNPLAASHPYSEPSFVEEGLDTYSQESYSNELEEYEENDYLDIVPEPVSESKIDTYSGTDNVQQAVVVDDDMDEIKKSAIDGYILSPDNDDSDAFDLRQGIIAQAILDRPYK